MIISASRRTDIPAFYADWFFQRLLEGFAYVRNPVNPRQVSRIGLSAEQVDAIVFWTKNPAPLCGRLDRLREFVYLFQFTLTPYGREVEQNLPPKEELISTFQTLSGRIGRERVVWRYDPILLSDVYTAAYHARAFEGMARQLSGYTETCTVSFLDFYTKTKRNTRLLGIREPELAEKMELMRRFAETGRRYGITINTCAEELELEPLGIGHARCIDPDRLRRIGMRSPCPPKDKNQRPACGCAASVDIGAYHTCPGGCRYCYANFDQAAAARGFQAHDPASPFLIGKIREGDVVRDRQPRIEGQRSLFDLL